MVNNEIGMISGKKKSHFIVCVCGGRGGENSQLWVFSVSLRLRVHKLVASNINMILLEYTFGYQGSLELFCLCIAFIHTFSSCFSK